MNNSTSPDSSKELDDKIDKAFLKALHYKGVSTRDIALDVRFSSTQLSIFKHEIALAVQEALDDERKAGNHIRLPDLKWFQIVCLEDDIEWRSPLIDNRSGLPITLTNNKEGTE